MTIDGQNNLHIRNTHTVEETKFCKILQFERECKRDIGGGREREKDQQMLTIQYHANHGQTHGHEGRKHIMG